MNKKELVKVVSEMTEKSQKSVTEVVDAVFFGIAESLSKGNDVNIPNFGKFITTEVEEREARNPKDGSSVVVPAHRKLKFKASSVLKNAVK